MVSINSVIFLVFLSLLVTFFSLGVVQGFKLHHSKKKLHMTFEGLGEVFEVDVADKCAKQFPLVLTGGLSRVSRMCRHGSEDPLPEHFLVQAECLRCP